MKYIHVTIYDFPVQTNWKRHVKIIFLNFTYLSFGFHADAEQETEARYTIIRALLSSEITHSVTKWVSAMLQCTDDRSRPRTT